MFEVTAIKLLDHAMWWVPHTVLTGVDSAIEKVFASVPGLIESVLVGRRAYDDIRRHHDKMKIRADGLSNRVQQLENIVQESTTMALELLGVAPHELAKTLRATLSDLRTANASLTRAGVPLCLGHDGNPQVSVRVQWLIDAREAAMNAESDEVEASEALVRCAD